MSRTQNLVMVTVAAIVISIIMTYLIYNYTGWVYFSMNKGDNFQIKNTDPTLVSKLRFKQCIFTTVGVDKTSKSYDISNVLYKMAAAYKNNKNSSYLFKLDDPGLSPYSFQIPGFNDKDHHPEVSNWGFDNTNTQATLSGYYKLLN